MELRSYQEAGVAFALQRRAVVLHMDRGLGKSLTSLITIQQLQKDDPRGFRILLVAGTNAQFTWEEEVNKWFGKGATTIMHFISGLNATKRNALWQKLQESNGPFIAVTTIQSLQRDLKNALAIKWDIVIVDECQKLRNRKTNNYKAVFQVTKGVPTILLLSGSLVTRGPQDLWTSLSILDRGYFKSYWAFVSKYCHTVETNFGLEIGGPKNTTELKRICNRYVYYKDKNDPEVAASIPEKTRQLVHVEITAEQKKLYNELVEDMIAEYGEELVITPSKLALFTRLRQLLVCPKILFPEAGLGAGVDDLMDKLKEASDEERHCIIYSPFTEVFPHLETALLEAGIKSVSTLVGGMKREDIAIEKEKFVGNQGVMLLSIDYAESLNLETASYGHFLGYSWAQDANYQAEDRIHRMTSKKPVFYYYYNYPGYITEYQLDTLGWKQRNTRLTWGQEPKLKNLLKA